MFISGKDMVWIVIVLWVVAFVSFMLIRELWNKRKIMESGRCARCEKRIPSFSWRLTGSGEQVAKWMGDSLDAVYCDQCRQMIEWVYSRRQAIMRGNYESRFEG